MTQCKDIPDKDILVLIEAHNRTAGAWCNNMFEGAGDVRLAMPDGLQTPHRLVLAKMSGLIRRGLVEGCACGCRGDYAITDRGMEEIGIEAEGYAALWYGPPGKAQRRKTPMTTLAGLAFPQGAID